MSCVELHGSCDSKGLGANCTCGGLEDSHCAVASGASLRMEPLEREVHDRGGAEWGDGEGQSGGGAFGCVCPACCGVVDVRAGVDNVGLPCSDTLCGDLCGGHIEVGDFDGCDCVGKEVSGTNRDSNPSRAGVVLEAIGVRWGSVFDIEFAVAGGGGAAR